MTNNNFFSKRLSSVMCVISTMTRFSLASLICLCMLTVGVGNAWGASVTWPQTTALPRSYTNIDGDANVQIKVSTTNSYINPIRVYANATISIKVASGYTIESVTYVASSTGNYVSYAQNATVSPSVTPTVSSKNVTWSYSSTTTEFTFKPSSQTRSAGITVVYSSTGGGSTPVTGVSVSPTSKSIVPGETFTITPTVAPAGASDKSVSWTSSVTSKATVNSSGVVTGVAAGTSTITCTTTDGSYTATCAVTVCGVTMQARDEDGNAIGAGGPGAPSRTGTSISPAADVNNYVFKEWQITNAELGSSELTKENTITNPTGAVTVTAVYYKPITITYKANGSTFTTQTYAYNGTLAFPASNPDGATYSCTGKTFVGWVGEANKDYSHASIAPTYVTAGSSVTEAATYYAVFAKATTTGGGGSTDVTIDLTKAAQVTTNSEENLVFTEGDVTFTNTKVSGQTNANNYCPVSSTARTSTRTYNGHEVTIAAGSTISKIVITAASPSYATAIKDATWTNGSATASSSTVTVTPSSGVSTVSFTPSATAGMIEVVVTTGGGGSTTYDNYITTCAADPCDALQAPNVTATATANSITLSWVAVDGATSYNVYNYTTEEAEEVNVLTYTFNELDPETEYEWEVEAVSATCDGKGTKGTTTTSATPYTVTFNAGSGTCDDESLTEASGGAGVTLPTANPPAACATDGWGFAGWWTGSVAETTTSPGELLTAGSNYKPTTNCTLYAVYSYTEAGGGGSTDYVLTNIGDIADDDIVVITMTTSSGTTYALSSSNGSSGAPPAQTVTVSDNKLSAEPEDAFKWNITNNTGSLTIYPNGTTETWLYCTTRNNGVRVGDNANKTFTIDATSGYLKHSNTSRYVGVYTTNPDWRCYTSSTEANIANQTLGFYVKSSGGSTTTYNSNPACLEPVWETNAATIDKTSFTVNCGGRSPMTGPNGAAIISFPTEKIYGFTKDITIEATTGFLVSTNQTEDANYQSSVPLSPLVGTANANTFFNKFVYVRAEAPAQSDTDLEGTITIKNNKGETLQTFSVTADVTCNKCTVQFVDRGANYQEPILRYAGETIDEAPADPEGVCTDPIHYVFDGWAEATVAAGSTTYTKVTFPYTVTGNTKFYAVYRYVEDGGADSGDYVKVTENLDDYSGDYLFVYETDNVAFDGGRNNVDDELDATNNTIEVTINDNTIASNTTTDAAKFTIAKVDGGYSIKSASGYYIGWGGAKNGLNTNSSYTVNYLNTISNNTICGKTGYLMYNKAADQKRFRYFQSGQEDIALYRKAASYLYTTSPICGPHLAITEGKEIYVTGGNAGGTRDLVIAQQKVSYKATRLQTSNGLDDGTAPDVKVATNGITVGGVVTTDVKVIIDQTKEQQTDGTYTITGTITVQYQPSANNKQEDIQVQLAVDYNAEARDNFTVHARSLPAEFVIVAKSGDKWYALNGDMNTNAANPANGQVTLDDVANPTKATYAPCNTIYTFDGLPNTGDRTYVRFQGTDGAWLWASSGTNVGIQNNVLKTTPEGNNNAYNWKLYTEDNITYRFGNANSSRQLTLSGEKFGMYASGVQDIRILPYDEKCLYNYAPSNLKVSVLKGTYVTLTWDAVIGATKYQYSTNGTNWTDCGTEPTATINDLDEGTEHTYYIRAYHEDDGVSQECIDYAEITFTTANCDDVPTDITYTADLTSITVSWTAAAPTATITYNIKEDGTGGGGTINNATSPYTISGGLNPNTTYYIQILADGTCGSPITPVKTEDVKMDIVEWQPDGIVVDINTNEKVKVTLENEVSYGSGTGTVAEDLFFSKYFEGSGSLKMLAIYNGTGKDVDLSTYRIDRGTNGDATNISITYDLSQLGIIKQGQEIIFYSWPLKSEYSYECSKSYLNNVATKSGQEDNPRWILCGNDPTEKATPMYGDAMNFSGDDPLLLRKNEVLIDVIGVSTAATRPTNKTLCTGRSEKAWSADGVTNMDYGKTEEDFEDGKIPHGVNVDNETITAYTARVIMFRKNTVVSGDDAVTKNIDNFVTFADEWEARQVCMSGDDGDLTCAAYQELGKFNYSEYYTKYESMDQDQEFDTNNRNADGTLTVPITELFKQSCRNIKITLKDAADNVLKEQPYKVPIMITSTQGTDGQTFLDLQQNLATVEVDVNGNPTGNKTNLTLEQVREICKTCDVVVRDNATLTKVTDGTTNDHPQVHNVYVYEGASIVIPDGVDHNYTINGLSLRRKGDVVASAQVQGTGKFVLPVDEPVCLELRVDANNWHWFTLPYDCDIADVTWIDGTPAKYNTDWFLMYYDGESRAASTNPHDNHWKVYNGTTIEAGKGYIVGITGDLTHPNYTFELRFPMAQEVLTAEQNNKTVPVNAWGVQSDNTPNNLGWNLVGNPYLNYYKTADEYSLAGLPLIHYTYTDPVTGKWYYDNSGSVPYVVTPIDGGWYEYQQELASGVNLMPFTAYFVQVGDPNTHTNGQALNASFEADNRGKKSIVRRAPREVEEIEEPIIVRVELTNSKGESDKTSLVIADRFTNEYEMQADFFKWFGDYYNYYTKPVLYTIGADQGKRAFNALNEELAAQPIPMGMYAAQAGNYTFSLNQQFDLSRVEEVWLYDATQSTYTNLMQSDYTFSTSKVNGAGRFSLSVKLAPKVATSIDNVTADKVWATTHTKQVIVNGLDSSMHLWLYDATGKLLYNEPTSNYQHTYSVPQTGTYFVSVMKGNAKQTIKVVVE